MYNTMDLAFDKILMDGISDMVFVISVEQDSIFTYRFLNRAAMNGTGLTENVLGKAIREVNSQETGVFLYEQYEKVVTTGECVTYKDSYVTATGETSYSKTKLTPLFDDLKNCTQIVAAVKDTTKKKRAELKVKKTWEQLNEINIRYQSLIQHNSDAIIFFDLSGRITNGNIAVESVTGYKPVELIGTTLNSLVVKDDRHRVKKLFTEAVAGVAENAHLAILNKTGNRIELSAKVLPLIVGDEVTGIYGMLRDVTDMVGFLRKLEESEERLRIIAESAQDLITLIDDKGEIIYASPSYKNVLGFDYKEYVGEFFLHNVHPDDRNHVDEAVLQSIKTGKSFIVQFKQFDNTNNTIWSEAHGTPVLDSQNNFKHMVVLTRDIHLQKEYETQLENFALHDPLTGLPNRRLLKQTLTVAIEKLQEKSDGLAVIMMDIDHFKKINDGMGHDIGDGVIEEYGKRASEVVPNNGMVARLGGDEFVVLLPGIETADKAISIAEAIQKTMHEPWNINGKTLTVTTSMGIAMAPPQGATVFSMLKNADLALYEAKDAGRNSYKLKDFVGDF